MQDVPDRAGRITLPALLLHAEELLAVLDGGAVLDEYRRDLAGALGGNSLKTFIASTMQTTVSGPTWSPTFTNGGESGLDET